MERAGRGGKEATVIEQLDLSPAERRSWLKALKAALGCGGSNRRCDAHAPGRSTPSPETMALDRGVKRVTIG